MQNLRRRGIGPALFIGALLILSPAFASAQDPNQQQENPPQQNPPADNNQDTPPPPATPVVPTPLDTQIHPAGQAVPWLGTSSPLRWGDLAVGDFTYNYVHSQFTPFGQPSENLDLDIFRRYSSFSGADG